MTKCDYVYMVEGRGWAHQGTASPEVKTPWLGHTYRSITPIYWISLLYNTFNELFAILQAKKAHYHHDLYCRVLKTTIEYVHRPCSHTDVNNTIKYYNVQKVTPTSNYIIPNT